MTSPTIEKLTDDDRREIQVATADRDVRFKALRIIDAQAAVIERVEKVYDEYREYHPSTRRGLLDALAKALAAAPEHTVPEAKHNRIWMSLKHPAARYAPMIGAPNNYMGMTLHPEGAWCRNEDVKLLVAVGEAAQAEVSVMRARVEELEQKLSGQCDSNESLTDQLFAANARVVELKAALSATQEHQRRIAAERDAANDRADAAERKLETEHSAAMTAEADMRRAESEAAQWKSAHDRALDDVAALRAEVKRLTLYTEERDKTAEALRAEAERLRAGNVDIVSRANVRLSTATELLGKWCAAASLDGEAYGSLYDESLAISTTRAPTERVAAECVSGYTGANGECNDCGKLDCQMADHERQAELARRAVAGK